MQPRFDEGEGGPKRDWWPAQLESCPFRYRLASEEVTDQTRDVCTKAQGLRSQSENPKDVVDVKAKQMGNLSSSFFPHCISDVSVQLGSDPAVRLALTPGPALVNAAAASKPRTI